MSTRMLMLSLVALATCVLCPLSQDHRDAVADPNEGTCRISGTVRRGGSPVEADIRVYLRMPVIAHSRNIFRRYVWLERRMLAPPTREAPVATAVAGPDGRFVLKGLKPGRYDVIATGAEAATGGIHVPLFAPGQYQDVAVGLRPASESLKGSIHTKDGKPYVGTVVAYQGKLLWPSSSGTQPIYEHVVQTDGEGRFTLTGLAPERTTIAILKPGHLWLPITRIHASSKATLNLKLDEPATRYEAQVLDAADGKPIANARVYWSAFGLDYPVGSTSTDDQGRFRVGHAARIRGIDEIHVLAPGYGRYKGTGGPRGSRPQISLRRGAHVQGRVTDIHGSPVAGITVRIEYVETNRRTWICPPAITDDLGRYTMEDLPWGEVHIYARGNGWVPAGFSTRSWFDTHDEGERFDPSVWSLVPGKTLVADHRVEPGVFVTGTVREPDGSPVVGAPITVETESNDPDFLWPGGVAVRAATDKDGRYTVAGLLPHGRYLFSAKVRGYAEVKSDEVAVGHRRTVDVDIEARPSKGAPPDSRAGSAIKFREPHWVLLTVVDDKTGLPVPDAYVYAMIDMAPGHSSRHELTWTTDSKGAARIGPLGPQTGDVGVYAEGYLDRDQIQFGKPSTDGKPFTVRLKKALTIEGAVLLPDGRPAPSGRVTLDEMEGPNYHGVKGISPQGKFVAESVHDVPYALHAQHSDEIQDYEAKGEARGGAKDVVLRLAPVPGSAEKRKRPKLHIRVVGPDDRPVPFASLRIDSGWGVDIKRVRSGLYVIDPAPKKAKTLEARDARAIDGYPLDLAPIRMDLPRTTGEVVIRMVPGTPILGRLLGPEGEAIPRAKIVVRPLGADSRKPMFGSLDHDGVRTQADGTFRIATVGQESYVLEILPPPGYAVPLRRPRVTPSASPIEVRLRRTVNATLRTRDSAGNPVAGAQVEVHLPGLKFNRRFGWELGAIRYGYATTDENGVARLGSLDPDLRYALSVKPPEGTESLRGVEDSNWRPRDQDVTLEGTGTIRGRVSYAPGMAKDDVHVYYAGSDGVWHSTWVSDDGSFEVSDVPVGTYRLAAVSGHPTRPDSETEVVKAKTGATEVHLRVSPGAVLTLEIEGTIPDSDSGPHTVLLIPERAADREAAHAARSDSRAVARVVGLRKDCSYTLWVEPFGKDARSAWITGVRPSEKTLRVATKPSKSIRVSVISDRDPAFVEVRAYGPHPRMKVWARATEGQSEFEIAGLADLEWRVVVRAVVGRQWVNREVKARPGRSVKIDLGAP